LDAAGADCTNILARRYGDFGNLNTQLSQLESDLRNEKPLLLIIDPILAFLGGLDSHRNDEVRSLFARLTDLAHKYDVAVVVISHLNKSTAHTQAMHRVTGSQGFVAAARAVYLVERDPANPDDRLFLALKNNLGDDQTGFRFRLAGDPGAIPQIEWDADPVTITADELLNHQYGKQPSALEDAQTWLRDALANGPRESLQLRAMAEKDGINWRTLRRAQKSIGIKPYKSGLKDGWIWALPEDNQTDDFWTPSGNHLDVGQLVPKMANPNEQNIWPSSKMAKMAKLATFEGGQTQSTLSWPPSTNPALSPMKTCLQILGPL